MKSSPKFVYERPTAMDICGLAVSPRKPPLLYSHRPCDLNGDPPSSTQSRTNRRSKPSQAEHYNLANLDEKEELGPDFCLNFSPKLGILRK